MFSLEQIDQFLKGDIAFDEESVPDRPFDFVVLCFRCVSFERGMRGREGEEGRTLFLAMAMGSEKPKNGRARLTNPFLYCSISVFPSMIYLRPHQYLYLYRRRGGERLTLYNSRQTSPVAKLVVVAIAGMIFPATCLV